MTAFFLTVALFAVWCLIGLAVLAVVRADLTSLRIVLTAPALGTATMVLPLFVLSTAGMAMENGASLVTIALLVASVAVLALKRPRVARSIAPVLAICGGGLLLAGWPMFGLGFRWIANANDDMANYVLSATALLHHGLLGPLDLAGLSHGRDYPSVMEALHKFGSRPGSDITLAALADITGRPAYEIFMPFILALNLCMICGTAALAMQAAQRWWAAAVAAALVAVSPLATFGVLQQLVAQVWGLGLATALCALLMRRELHQGSRPGLRDVAPISILVTALLVAYIELAATVALVYALYLGLLVVRREFDLRVAARLWVPAIVVSALVLNAYGIRELHYIEAQTSSGTQGAALTNLIFGFALVPNALSGIVGLQQLPAHADASLLGPSIAVAAILLVATLTASVLTAVRGVGASIAVVAYASLGILLDTESSAFGLFKLFMYVQPFLAAAIAVWAVSANRRLPLVLVALPLALFVALQLPAQQANVQASRDPGGLPDASAGDLLPAFRSLVSQTRKPIISVTENPTLGKLEAVSAGQHPLYFISQDLFGPLIVGGNTGVAGWQKRSFELVGFGTKRVDTFWENTHASAVLSTGRCTIVLPSGPQTVLNRRSLPLRTDFVAKPCDSARDILVFTASTLGSGFYAAPNLKQVAFYQTERDPFSSRETMEGFGKDVLFRILKPSGRVRLEVDLTTTFVGNGASPLPPASVIGQRRTPLPLVGGGSARVFSAPIQLQRVDGQSYALLDMGRAGELPPSTRPGLQGVYGRSVPLDPRYLTADVRDISVVTDAEYDHLRPPSELDSFPTALANPNLEYSGIYEDGRVTEDSYAVLASGGASDLVLRADVPAAPGGQRLEVLVNGRRVAARGVAAGHLELRVPLPASRIARRVELRWASAPHVTNGPAVAAVLAFLGVVPRGSAAVVHPPSALQHFPADLTPGLSYSGIYSDGWLQRQAFVVLAGGPAAELELRAEVPPAPGGQRLKLLVNGHQLTSRAIPSGQLDLTIAVPASTTPRRIELRWAAAPKLPAPDTRSAAALIQFLGIVAPPKPPSALQHFPADLTPGLSYSGIYSDGWLQRQAFVVLAGGPAAELELRAEVPPAPGGQRLKLLVNGHQLTSRAIPSGQLDLTIAVPASTTPRRIELRWAAAPKLPAPDTRSAAALIQFLGIVAPPKPPSALQHFPADLTPGLSYSGIYSDGWLQRQAFVVLAGGPAAELELRAEVPPAPGGQRLKLLVNGHQLTSRAIPSGQLDLTIAVPASTTPRRIELRWAAAPKLPAPDTRSAAALIQFLGIVPASSP